MKHLFIVNPVAGKQKPEDKLRLINEAIDRLPAEQRERDRRHVLPLERVGEHLRAKLERRLRALALLALGCSSHAPSLSGPRRCRPRPRHPAAPGAPVR